MPELAEVKIMSEYINYVSKDETYVSVEKSKELDEFELIEKVAE